MASWKQVERTFTAILNELGNPTITLLTPSQFEYVTGKRLGGCSGKMVHKHFIVTVRRNRSMEHLKNTLWHEVGHCLFGPRKPHWWIECFAAKMAGTPRQRLPHFVQYAVGGERRGVAAGRYSAKYCHALDELPGRATLLKMARERAVGLVVDHEVDLNWE